MVRPCGSDLHQRVVDAINGDLAARTAAARFSVARTSTIKWHQPRRAAFSKLKALLGKAAARTKLYLWDAMAMAIETFMSIEGTNYFAAAGYDRD